MIIDERLINACGEAEITENFNRVLSYFDALAGNITCTVTFSTDGGGSISPQNVPFGGLATLPEAPTKTGSTFAGWYLGEKVFDFNTPVMKSMTLTAHWTTA